MRFETLACGVRAFDELTGYQTGPADSFGTQKSVQFWKLHSEDPKGDVQIFLINHNFFTNTKQFILLFHAFTTVPKTGPKF